MVSDRFVRFTSTGGIVEVARPKVVTVVGVRVADVPVPRFPSDDVPCGRCAAGVWLAREAPAWLDVAGTLVCEITPQRAEAAAKVASAAGFEEVLVRPDLAGRDRVLVARMLG